MFDVKNLALSSEDCLSLVTRMITLTAPQFNWIRKRTIEEDMHPGSDHPQCQHIKMLAWKKAGYLNEAS